MRITCIGCLKTADLPDSLVCVLMGKMDFEDGDLMMFRCSDCAARGLPATSEMTDYTIVQELKIAKQHLNSNLN